MDMDELGYFLFMDAMEKKQKEDASLNFFAEDEEECDDGDDE